MIRVASFKRAAAATLALAELANRTSCSGFLIGICLMSLVFDVPKALACTEGPAFSGAFKANTQVVAHKLVSSAASIDVAVVERMSPDFDFMSRSLATYLGSPPPKPTEAQQMLENMRADWRTDGARIHYRVLQRLKGHGAERFSFSGVRFEKPTMSPVQLRYFFDQSDLADWYGAGSCQSPISGFVGQRYLIFRDGSGRLLKAIVPFQWKGQKRELPGPAAVPITGPTDPWMRAVRRELK